MRSVSPIVLPFRNGEIGPYQCKVSTACPWTLNFPRHRKLSAKFWSDLINNRTNSPPVAFPQRWAGHVNGLKMAGKQWGQWWHMTHRNPSDNQCWGLALKRDSRRVGGLFEKMAALQMLTSSACYLLEKETDSILLWSLEKHGICWTCIFGRWVHKKDCRNSVTSVNLYRAIKIE